MLKCSVTSEALWGVVPGVLQGGMRRAGVWVLATESKLLTNDCRVPKFVDSEELEGIQDCPL